MSLKKTSLTPLKSKTPQEKYWQEVNSKARQLITEAFNHPLIEEEYTQYLQEYQTQAEVQIGRASCRERV